MGTVNHEPSPRGSQSPLTPSGFRASRLLRRDGAQGGHPGDVGPRVDVEFLQDVRDVGRHGPAGQQQLGGDLRVGQSLLDDTPAILISVAVRLSQPLRACRCLACGPRRMPCARNAAWSRATSAGRAQRRVDLHGRGERGPGLAAVAGVDELPRRPPPAPWPAAAAGPRRHSAPRRPAAGGILVQQPAAVQRVRLPVRDLRPGGECVGLAGEGPRGVQIAGLDAEPDGVGQQVLDLLKFLGVPPNPSVSAASASGSAPSCSRSRLRARASGPMSRCPTRSACGHGGSQVPARGVGLARGGS